MQETGVNVIYEKYSRLGVQQWRTDLVKSVSQSTVDGVAFPTFPAAELQRQLQGSSNETSIRGALAFREFCIRIASEAGAPFSDLTTLLDFGTGWGRIARAFMRDVPASRIFAVEPFDFILDARRTNVYINIVKTDPLPPLPFRGGAFTHLVTYSTFTHFNKEFFDTWLIEFARIMQPGGLCFVTVLGVSFLQRLKNEIKRKQAGDEVHFWTDLIISRIEHHDVEPILRRTRDGEFVWLPTGQAARQEWAECFVTRTYFELNFGDLFEVIYETTTDELAQDCVVLRRR
jgi:hypothetical protein